MYNEYWAGQTGQHPGSDVPLDYNWAAYWDGHYDEIAAEKARDSWVSSSPQYDYGCPTSDPYSAAHSTSGYQGAGGGGAELLVVALFIGFVFWKFVLATTALAAIVYGLSHVPKEKWVAIGKALRATVWKCALAALHAFRRTCLRVWKTVLPLWQKVDWNCFPTAGLKQRILRMRRRLLAMARGCGLRVPEVFSRRRST